MPKPLRVLLVQESEDDAALLVRELRRGGYEPSFQRVETADAMSLALAACEPDVVITDYGMPDFRGPQAIELTQQFNPELPIIVISDGDADETAVAAMRMGASDFLTKKHLAILPLVVQREMRKSELRRELKDLQAKSRENEQRYADRVREAEAALGETNEKYRSLVEQAPDAIFVADSSLHMIDLNRRACELSGYSREEILGMSIPEFLAKEDLYSVPLKLDELRKGKTVVTERRLVRKDQTFLSVEVSAKALRDGRLQAVIRDISERKRNEEEREQLVLRERTACAEAEAAKKEITKILESISDAFVSLDHNWNYTYVNAKAADIFGRRREDLIGRNIWTEFPAGEDQPFYEAYHRAVDDQVSIELQAYYPPYDRWFENRIYPSQDGLSIFFHDITDRKQAEEELRTSEERFSKAFSLGPHRMGIIRIEDGAVIDVNERWLQETGFQKDEVVGRSVLDMKTLFANEEKPRIQQLLKAGKPFRDIEFRVSTKTGEQRVVRSSAEVVELRDEPCLLFAANDITERKRSEALINGQKRVLEMIAMGAPWRETLDALLRIIEAQSKDMLCSILLLDDDRMHVRHAAAPSLPESYTRAIDGAPVGPRAGSCGTAVFRREPVIVADIMTDPLWEEYRALAAPHGLRACWSTPIFDAQHRVIGTFAIYYPQPGLPTEQHERLIAIATQTAAVCLNRKKAEEALRESETKFRILAESAASAILMYQSEKIIYANPATAAITGYSVDELLTMSLWDLIHEESRAVIFEGLPSRETGSLVSARNEVRLLTKHGDKRWVDYSVGSRYFEGRPTTIGTAFDITERKEAELRANELSYFLSKMRDAVTITDLDSRFIYWNQGAEQLFGWSAKDAIGSTAAQLFPDTPFTQRESILQCVTETGQWYGEIQTSDRQGRKFFTESSWTLVRDISGQPKAIITTSSDITDRKQAEDALRTSEEQLRALSARMQTAREEEGARIAREIHDELGSALTGLKWDLEAIDKTLRGSDTEAESNGVRKRISSMTGLIEATINTVRRIASELRPGMLDDLGLIAAIDWQAEQFQARTGIKYHTDTALDTVDLSTQAATAVFRIFQEILTNVLRHAQATAFYVTLREHRGCVELKVRDNGRGITKREMDNTRSLGLLGMKERALLVGGEVNLDGRKGEGTVVVVRVPIKSQVESAHA